MSGKTEEYAKKLQQAQSVLNMIADDNTTPRNIRRAAKQAADMLISLLEDISQDPNMPMYSRTRIWNGISLLEGIRD
jgi:uncharacterized protein (UPF0147 family)